MTQVIAELERQRAALVVAINELKAIAGTAAARVVRRGGKRTMSEAGRERIRQSALRRWRKAKREGRSKLT